MAISPRGWKYFSLPLDKFLPNLLNYSCLILSPNQNQNGQKIRQVRESSQAESPQEGQGC